MTGARIGGSLLRMAAALALLGVSGCATEAPVPTGEPTFYRNLARAGSSIRPPRSR